jgi:Secretion system C-terminal sorting domain
MNGNDDKTMIHILKEKIDIIGSNIDLEYDDGEFEMLGLCQDGSGGKRLIGNSDRLELKQCKPSPASGLVEFEFTLIEDTYHQLVIFDAVGSMVKVLSSGKFQPNHYQISFNSEQIANGVYFYRLLTARGFITRKMIILN